MTVIEPAGATFGQLNFGGAQLGDKRRTRRLVNSVDRLHRHPGGTLPDKFQSPADLDGFYRLMNSPVLTHEAILRPHRAYTGRRIDACCGEVLILHDSTELDYTGRKTLREDLGQIGNGNHFGYICHNSLAVGADTREVLGLTSQILHQRAHTPKDESITELRERKSRESRLWIEGVEKSAAASDADQVIDICDRGADTFEFLEHQRLRCPRRLVVRSSHNRKIHIGHAPDTEAETTYLHDYARALPELGRRTVQVCDRPNQPRRTATVAVSAAAVLVCAPHGKRGQHGNQPLALWIIRVWEPSPPEKIRVRADKGKGRRRRQNQRRKYREYSVEPVEWFLLTSDPVPTFEEVVRRVGWYECRWIIEEYHKAQKTGCGIETFQFTSVDRLQPAIAVTSVIALTLLQLRDASRRPDAQHRLATDLISSVYVRILGRWRYRKERAALTIAEFFLALARLGGHQNRKHDHRPGWLVLWRGWTKLQHMVEGARAAEATWRGR